MSVLLPIILFLHIVSAFTWFALGTSLALFILPTAQRSGENGLNFLRTLYTATPFEAVIPISAVLTTLAGIIMYIPGVGGGSALSNTGKVVLTIGALAGLACFGHGAAVTGRATSNLVTALKTPADEPSVQRALVKLAVNSRISFFVMMVALIGMASARYL